MSIWPEATKLITAPADEPWQDVQVAEHVRSTAAAERAMIAEYAKVAREMCENYTRRAFIDQTWQAVYNGFPGRGVIYLPRPPLSSVTSVAYIDTNGDSQTLATSVYRVVNDDDTEPFIELAWGQTWPSTRAIAHTVTITCVCGYGTKGEDVPAPLRQAVLIQAADLFDNRDSIVVGTIAGELSNQTARALLGPFITDQAA